MGVVTQARDDAEQVGRQRRRVAENAENAENTERGAAA
jgi:hypothetical protein